MKTRDLDRANPSSAQFARLDPNPRMRQTTGGASRQVGKVLRLALAPAILGLVGSSGVAQDLAFRADRLHLPPPWNLTSKAPPAESALLALGSTRAVLLRSNEIFSESRVGRWADGARKKREKAGDPFRAKSSWYVAAVLPYASISDDDFDGNSAVAGGGSAEIMPTVDSGFGVGFAVGYRARGNSMEFNYTKIDHDGEFLGFPIDSESTSFNFDYRRHFRLNHHVQPHILIGVGLSRLSVEDGSLGTSGQIEDAVFSGANASIGGGVSYFITRQISLSFDAGYRFQSYSSVDGVVDGELSDRASGSGVFGAFRVTFAF